MSDNSRGDSAPLTFNSPDLQWSEPAPTETAPPAVESTATDATTAPSPADATTPPVDAAPSPDAVAPLDEGPIPFARHKEILESVRSESAELRNRVAQLEWADALVKAGRTPDEVQQGIELLQGLNSDYVGTLDKLLRVADQHPDLQTHIRSLAGRWLGQGAGGGNIPQAPQEDPEPQPDFVDSATGRPFMSTERMREWSQWNERRLVKSRDEKYGPLVKSHEESQKRARLEQQFRQFEESLNADFNRYKDKPHFKENHQAIYDLIKQSGWRLPIADAYNEVLVTKVMPNLSQTASANTLADLQRQAAASSAVKPSDAATVTPAGVKSFTDPRLKWT